MVVLNKKEEMKKTVLFAGRSTLYLVSFGVAIFYVLSAAGPPETKGPAPET